MLVYVARHGETTWNKIGRYQGRRESGLSALGMQQGFALGNAFTALTPRVGRVVSSPLLRTSATAGFVAERLGLPVEHDDRLLEIAHGTWEGRMRDELTANDPERMRAWKEAPASISFEGGETLADVATRWNDFARTFDARVPALIVTHDAVVRVAILAAQNRALDDLWRVDVENAGYAVFDVHDAQWTLIEQSVTSHLAGLRADVTGQAL